MTWRPISDPPPPKPAPNERTSIRVLGILADGLHVFAQYTPYYLGRPDERQMLWTCENFGWATKPAYWQPLEPLPGSVTK